MTYPNRVGDNDGKPLLKKMLLKDRAREQSQNTKNNWTRQARESWHHPVIRSLFLKAIYMIQMQDIMDITIRMV